MIDETRIKALEEAVKAMEEKLRSISGIPIIKAHSGCVFDLNGNLNVLQINKRLGELETFKNQVKEGGGS